MFNIFVSHKKNVAAIRWDSPTRKVLVGRSSRNAPRAFLGALLVPSSPPEKKKGTQQGVFFHGGLEGTRTLDLPRDRRTF